MSPISETERTQIRSSVQRPTAFNHEQFVHMSFQGSMEQVSEFLTKLIPFPYQSDLVM
jgi:hypothetical protein